MPNATIETVVKITLVLNETEAKWLKDYLQNGIVPPEQELVEDRLMRESFFRSLNTPREVTK